MEGQARKVCGMKGEWLCLVCPGVIATLRFRGRIMKKSITLLVASAFLFLSVPAFACGEHSASNEADEETEVTASTKDEKEVKGKKSEAKKSETKDAKRSKGADTKA